MTTAPPPNDTLSTEDVQALLDESPPRHWWRRTWIWMLTGFLVLTGAAAYFCAAGRNIGIA